MPDKVESIWDIERQIKDGEQLLALLADVKAQILAVPKIMLEYKGATDIAAIKAATEQLIKANIELEKSQQRLNNIDVQAEILRREKIRTETEVIRQMREELSYEQALQREKNKGLSQSAAERKMLNDLSNEYLQLNKSLKEQEVRYLNLAITQGRESAAAKEALKTALDTKNILKQLDADLGNHQRNVGNYASGFNGLNHSIQGLLREVPSVQSIPQLFLAWSNQLPQFFDQITKAKEGLKALADAAAESSAELVKTADLQKLAAKATQTSEEALGEQVESIIAAVGASREQAAALREQIAGTVVSGTASAEAAAAAGVHATELAINAGASLEDAAALGVQAEAAALAAGASLSATAALEAQTVATATATSAAAAQPGVLARVGKALFSVQTLLLAGVLILTQFGGQIINWIASLFKAEKGLDSFAESQARSNKLLEESKDAYVKATMEVSNLKIAFEQARSGIIQKDEAVKLYNDTIGKTAGYVKDLDEAEQALNKNAEAYVQFTLYKAAANTAMQKSSEKLVEAQLRAMNPEKFDRDAWYNFGMTKRDKDAVDAAYEEKNKKDVENFNNDAKNFKNAGDKLRLIAQTYSALFKFDYSGIAETPGKKDSGASSKKDSTKKILESDFELYKIDQLRKIKLLGEGVEDERNSYDKRIALLQEFSTESLTLAKAQGVEDLRLLKEKSAATKIAVAIANKKENDNELNIRDDHNKKFIEITKKHNEQLKKEREQLYKDLQDYANQYGEDIDLKNEEERFSKIQALDQQLADGRIGSLDEYNKQREAIDKEYEIREISDELKVLNYLLELAKEHGKSTVAIQKEINGLLEKLHNENSAVLFSKDALKDEEEALNRRKELYKQFAGEVKEAFLGLGAAIFDRQKNDIEEERTLLEERTAGRIDSINKELITEEEKANKIIAVEAQAAAQKELLSNRQKDLDVKKAQFDKGVALLNVGIDTARAVSAIQVRVAEITAKAAAAFPFSAVYAPAVALTASQIPIALGIGAIQAAAIAAKPIPKFEHGTDNSPKGWALTDEAGPELYINKDGSMYMGNNKPTLRYLEARTEIIPHKNIANYLIEKKIVKDNSEIKEAILWSTKQTIKELRKGKRTSVNVHVDSGFNSYIKKQVFD